MNVIVSNLKTKNVPVPVIKTASAIVVAAAMFLFIRNTLRSEKKGSEIPSPAGALPFIGHLLALGSQPRITIYKWFQELGKIYKIKVGSRNWIILNDLDLVHAILGDPKVNSLNRPSSAHSRNYSRGNRGIVFAEIGPGWQRARRAALQVLSSGMLKKYFKDIAFEAEYLVEQLIGRTQNDGSVDPLKHLKFYSSNSVYYINLGTRASSIDDPKFITVVDMVTKMFESGEIKNNLETFIPFLSFINYFSNSDAKREELMKSRDDFFTKLIEEADKQDGPNIMKALSEEKYELDMTDRMIVLSDVILAGIDTTAVTLNWMMAILCRFPETQTKIQAEIKKFSDNNDGKLPEATDLAEFPYLVCVMKESPRYRSISTFSLPREMVEDENVKGYHLPKGSAILVNMKAVHSTSDFENPEKFNPDRFTVENGKIKGPSNFIFGFGKRQCPGMYLAETEIFYALTRILSKCNIDPIQDKNGIPIYPDIDNPIDNGFMHIPLSSQYKFTLRNDQMN